MGTFSNSIQDQNFCDSHKIFPYTEAYATSEDLWAKTGAIANMEGVVKKKRMLWHTYYQLEIEKMEVNPEYTDLEGLLKSSNGDHVKLVCVVDKNLNGMGLYDFLHIQPKQTVDIPYQALVKVEGTITDIKTIEEEGKQRYEYYLKADSVEKVLIVKESSAKTAQTQTIFMQCSINTTITDQYGRIIADNGTNEIPDADMLITNETKIFYLPANITYSTDIDAYDTGTFNFTRISPIGTDISITKFENISVTASTKVSVGVVPNATNYTMSIDYNGDGETDEEKSPDVNETITVTSPAENVFDTGAPANPYPSIFGTHNGTMKPNQTITVSKLYTYPCIGTGGHTEYARIWNNSGLDVNASWNGYVGDWHNISFDKTVVLLANETYFYEIRTGSYPQIHHTDNLSTPAGFITCSEFVDANGKRYNNWIPAIRLE